MANLQTESYSFGCIMIHVHVHMHTIIVLFIIVNCIDFTSKEDFLVIEIIFVAYTLN